MWDNINSLSLPRCLALWHRLFSELDSQVGCLSHSKGKVYGRIRKEPGLFHQSSRGLLHIFTSLLMTLWIPGAPLNLKPVLRHQALRCPVSVVGIMGKQFAAKLGLNTVL